MLAVELADRVDRPSTWIVSPIAPARLKTASPTRAQRDDPLGVEVDQADGVGEHQHPVRDPLAEAAPGRPLGVGVLGVGVAGERGEAESMSASVMVRPRVTALARSGRRSPSRPRSCHRGPAPAQRAGAARPTSRRPRAVTLRPRGGSRRRRSSSRSSAAGWSALQAGHAVAAGHPAADHVVAPACPSPSARAARPQARKSADLGIGGRRISRVGTPGGGGRTCAKAGWRTRRGRGASREHVVGAADQRHQVGRSSTARGICSCSTSLAGRADLGQVPVAHVARPRAGPARRASARSPGSRPAVKLSPRAT